MPVEKCPFCGGKLQNKLEEFQHMYRGIPIRLSDIPHQICSECGEELVDSLFGRVIEDSIDQYCAAKVYDYDDLLTCEEVASLLSVSYQAITSMLSDGKLPGTKIGREWRIHYGMLMNHIQAMSTYNLSEVEKEVLIAHLQLMNSTKYRDNQ